MAQRLIPERDRRLELQATLVAILGSENVYFQPPPSVSMSYPAIVYRRDYRAIDHADNAPYSHRLLYLVTVIDPDPDSTIPGKVALLPTCQYDRFYVADYLNHDVFRLFF